MRIATDRLLLDINFLHIHLYFIATNYLCNSAPVEYTDNRIQSLSLVIIYRNRQK